MTDLLPYLLGFVILLVIVFRDALNRPSPGDRESFTQESERVKVTLKRLSEARQFMQVENIKSLLDGRPAWRKIVDMSEREPAKVVRMRRTK